MTVATALPTVPSLADAGLPPRRSQRLLTAADLAALPRQLPTGPVRYELDDGRLVVMAPTGDLHGAYESNIVTHLKVQGQWKGHGRVRCGENSVILRRDPDRVVGTDVCFFANRSLPILHSPEGYSETIPDLVVEVNSKNDTGPEVARKVADYLAAGVRLVWVADPDTRTVTAHRPGRAAETLAEDATLACEDIIPGFALPVAEVFRD
jgi:Uma2 family endonuclease